MSIKIDTSKVDEKIVDKYLKQFDLKYTGGLNAKVNRLEKHMTETTPEERLSAPCSVCGGESDMHLPECPFCGTTEVDESGAPADAPPPAGPSKVEPAGDEGDSDDDIPDIGDIDSPPEEAPSDAPPPERQPKAAKPAKEKKAKAPPAIVETSGTEIVSTAKLDAAVQAVQTAKAAGVRAYWDLGTALLDIYSNGLWKLRMAGTKQRFASFNAFCSEELDLSHTYAYQMMDVAKAFSPEDFAVIGHAKLTMILRMPEASRRQLTEEARAGRLPRARLEQLVSESGVTKETGRSTATRAATEAAAKKKREAKAERAAKKPSIRPDGEVTAVHALGRSKIPLFARPKKGGKPNIRAVSLTQDPHGTEELLNGVVVDYRVVKEARGLVLVIERRRAGDPAKE